MCFFFFFFFFSSRRRHTRSLRDWSSDVCSSDLSPPTSDGHRGAMPRRIIPVALRELDVTDGGLLDEVFDGMSAERDRKSTRLNSSHVEISYAVFCLKKKKKKTGRDARVRKKQ